MYQGAGGGAAAAPLADDAEARGVTVSAALEALHHHGDATSLSDASPKSGGAAGSPPASAVLTAGMDRALFVDSLKRSRDRVRHCRSVPFSVLLYALFITDICLHVSVGSSYDLEQGLRDTFGGGTTVAFPDGLAKADAWFDWVTGTFLPTALPDADSGGVPYPAWARGRVGGFSPNLIVGGVRLSTRRAAATACPLPAALSALYSDGSCRASSITGTGDLTPFGNASVAAAAGVGSAFTPTVVVGDSDGAQFQYFLDQRLPSEPDLVAAVGGLRAAGWLDNATADVTLQFALLNGELGMVARVGVDASFTAGGRVGTALDVSSLLLEPYHASLGGLIFLDLLMLFYWLYLLWGTGRRVGSALCGAGGAHRPPPGAGCCAWSGYRLGRLLCNYWRLLDITTTVSMITTFSVWFSLLTQLKYVQVSLENAASAAAGGSVASVLEQDIFNAVATFQSAKVAAVVTLLLLTLRLFKYFKFQVRRAAWG